MNDRWHSPKGRLPRTTLSLTLGMALGVAASAAPPNGQAAADLILTNGIVIPMTAPSAQATALAVRGGKIVALGSDAEIGAWRGPATQAMDLNGKTVLPGFIDAHGHFSNVGLAAATVQLQPPPVGATANIPTLQRQLAERVAKTKAGWIVGFGYDDSLLTEQRHPTRQELDKVSADRPILIVHASGHLGVLNTKLLEMTGMLHPQADPPGGVIAREADGKTAAGMVEETALKKAMALMPASTIDQSIALVGMAQQVYASNGITSAQEGAMSPGDWSVLQEAARRQALKIDVHALPDVGLPWKSLESLPFGKPYENRLRVAGIKIVMDGSPQGRTAWLTLPYYHPPHGKPGDYAGYPRYPDAELDGYLKTAASRGWQVYAHVNGDAAIQQLIDGVKRTNATSAQPLRRTIAIHAQTASTGQLKAMKTLDMQPSFFASHTFFWGDWHREVVFGAERAERISPQREAFDLGLRPTIHNDSPVVPPDMIRLIWSAVTRRTRSNDILGAYERVTPYEALQEVTVNAAYEIFEEKTKGTLEVGKLADLVILSGNPLTLATENLLSLKVDATIKEGAMVWQRKP